MVFSLVVKSVCYVEDYLAFLAPIIPSNVFQQGSSKAQGVRNNNQRIFITNLRFHHFHWYGN